MSNTKAFEKTYLHLMNIKYDHGNINDVGIEIGYSLGRYFNIAPCDFYNVKDAISQGIKTEELNPTFKEYITDDSNGYYHLSCKVNMDFNGVFKEIANHFYNDNYIVKNSTEVGKSIGQAAVKSLGINRDYLQKSFFTGIMHGLSYTQVLDNNDSLNFRELIKAKQRKLEQLKKEKKIGKKEKIIIMPDFGDAIFWNMNHECSGNFELFNDYWLSEKLSRNLNNWHELFIIESDYEGMINWDRFNELGKELATDFKREYEIFIEKEVDVYYEKPREDPNHEKGSMSLIN